MELRALAGDERFGKSLLELNVVNTVPSGQGAVVGPCLAWPQRLKTDAQGHG